MGQGGVDEIDDFVSVEGEAFVSVELVEYGVYGSFEFLVGISHVNEVLIKIISKFYCDCFVKT